jgi:hypothetical protein
LPQRFLAAARRERVQPFRRKIAMNGFRLTTSGAAKARCIVYYNNTVLLTPIRL